MEWESERDNGRQLCRKDNQESKKELTPTENERTEWETRTSESPPKGMEAGVLTCQLRVVFG